MEEGMKSKLEEICIKLFATKGYQAVGVQEICSEAGITKPTLYYYFGSKTGILEHIVSHGFKELYEILEKASEYTRDFIKGLTRLLEWQKDYALKNPETFRLYCILENAPEGSEEKGIWAPWSQKIFDLYLNFFELSCNEFGNMRQKEKLYSLLFRNNVNAAVLQAVEGSLELTDDTVYRIIHSFVYGVAN